MISLKKYLESVRPHPMPIAASVRVASLWETCLRGACSLWLGPGGDGQLLASMPCPALGSELDKTSAR